MGTTAQFMSFGPYLSAGEIQSGIRVYHYAAGTSSLKDAYLDRYKIDTAPQPLVAGSNGVASAYFDGLYKIIVKTSDDTTTLFTWNNVNLCEAQHRLEGQLTWDPGSLSDGDGETSSGIAVTGAAFGDFVLVAAPYDLQGLTCTGYVSAANTVKIRLQNESGGSVDLASGNWKVRVLRQ